MASSAGTEGQQPQSGRRRSAVRKGIKAREGVRRINPRLLNTMEVFNLDFAGVLKISLPISEVPVAVMVVSSLSHVLQHRSHIPSLRSCTNSGRYFHNPFPSTHLL